MLSPRSSQQVLIDVLNLLFLPNAYIIKMNVGLYMCILMGKRLAVFLNSFLSLQSFWG